MQKLNTTSTQQFSPDQKHTWSVEYWDTPYACLENDVASGGIVMDIREPKSGGSWVTYLANLKAVASNTSALTTFQDATNSTATATNGRTPVLEDYWSGGAPGWHGVSTTGSVAYHFRCYLRSTTGRAWWNAATNPAFFLAVAGQGYLRIETHIGATTNVIFNAEVTEAEFLKRGFKFSTDVTTMAAGDYLDIYYVQAPSDAWGGYVIKLCDGPQSATESVNQDTAQRAQVLGCSAFDDNSPPSRTVLKYVNDVDTSRVPGQSANATFTVPLINTLVQDGFGWEWYRPSLSSNGQLRLWDAGAATTTILKRKRLIRIKQAFVQAEGTATGTQSSTTLQDTTKTFATNAFTGYTVEIVSGTGVGQYRTVASNTSTTLTLATAWSVTPDATSRYLVKEEYPVFTGFIHDYGEPDRKAVAVQCVGFDSRLVEQFDKNYPDKISYMSRGFYKLTETTDPIYDTACFDNWPMEFVASELLTRAGIPASRMTQPLAIGKDDGSTSAVQFNFGATSVLGNTTETLAKFRARTVAGKYLKLSRQVNYGNAGLAYTEAKPTDDAYIFPPENTRDLWSRLRDITERYGYDFWFDEAGDAVLRPRGAPFAAVSYATADASGVGGGVTVTQKLAPSAYGGTYIETVGAPVTFSKTVTAARIDISFPTGSSLGQWRVKVYKSGVIQNGANGVVVNPATGATAFYYDQYQTTTGVNSTLVTVWTGEYATYQIDVIAEPVTADTTIVRRLNAIFLYAIDPVMPRLPQVLSTKVNTGDIALRSNMDDMRNLVTVVGQRKATTTDSAKFTEQNPSNPEAEFIVQRQVNAGSIIDPTDETFIGYKKESVIYDTKITSPDMAAYIANLFIYRQKNPSPSASVRHTALPCVQLRDPVYAQDEQLQTITSNTTLYVVGVRHRFTATSVLTTLELTPFQEYPAFAPREDVDIDANYAGQPVVNVQIKYASLTGQTQTNPALTAIKNIDLTDVVATSAKTVQTGGLWGEWLNMSGEAWPPAPGTVQLQASSPPTGSVVSVDVPDTAANWVTAHSDSSKWLTLLQTSDDGPGTDIPVGGGATYALPSMTSITSITCKRYDAVIRIVGSTLVLYYDDVGSVNVSAGDDGVSPFYWEWDSTRRSLHVTHVRKDPQNLPVGNFQNRYIFHVTGTAPVASNSGYKGNTPYHHYMNVDYRTFTSQQNLLKYSEDQTNAVWQLSQAVVSTTSMERPDGTTGTVSKVAGTNVSGTHYMFQTVSSTTAGATYTASGWFKPAGQPWVRFNTNYSNSGTQTVVFFDITNGAVGTVTQGAAQTVAARITAHANGWYRCEVTFGLPVGATLNNVVWLIATGDNATSFTGDNTTGYYVWGAQLNPGSTAHAYVPTTSTTNTNQTIGYAIHLPWVEGDGTTNYVRPTGVTAYTARYRPFYPLVGASRVDPYSGNSPFYDPYTSELGYLVNLSFDALVTGFYRISVRAVKDNTVVAWLTEPTADPDTPEAHYSYLVAGGGKTYNWDGVDQRGEWNATQSEWYAVDSQGAFEKNEKPVIGRGFYAWNREIESSGALGPLAFIAADTDTVTGKPTFPHGTYGAWYVLIEAWNDHLAEVAADNPSDAVMGQLPRRVSTESLVTAGGLNSTSSAYIFTHLPKPTRCTLEIADWKSTAPTFDDTNPAVYANESNWIAVTAANYATDNPDAIINNQRPTRLRFVVEPRPGVLWSGKSTQASVRTFRVAHPRVTIFDQFVTWDGTLYPQTATPNRRITTRRLMNDSHTLVFEDESYRKAYTFKNSGNLATGTAEWIFAPKYFKKQFRVSGVTESIRFMDYLQLEEVPGWDPTQANSGVRARYQIGFMAYQWFLSAYTQDRSGRFSWAMDPYFVDKTKLVNNDVTHWPNTVSGSTAVLAKADSTTYRLDWPTDPMRQHRRTVVTRQWTSEGTWQADQRTAWGFSVGSIGDTLLRHRWADHQYNTTSIAVDNINTGAPTTRLWSSFTGLGTDNYSTYHLNIDGPMHLRLPSGFSTTRQLGVGGGSPTTALNGWTWQSSPLWIPSVTRDFHPYYLLPPMPSPTGRTSWRKEYTYAITDGTDETTDADGRKIGDDAARWNTWSSPIWDMTTSYSTATDDTAKVRFWPGNSVKYNKWPTQTVDLVTCDYVRQDETAHFEDLRGTFSHREKPAEGPTKVTPGSPYWINQFTYSGLSGSVKDGYPQLAVNITDFFTMRFRNEYLWESATLFPTNVSYGERLDATNLAVTRFDMVDRTLKDAVRYDAGAWTGWKETTGVSNLVTNTSTGGVFDSQVQPVALGPVITNTTKDMYFHLVLVSSRR